MIGLTGIRVLVVDDKIDEAAPVLRALAGRGIPAAYFNGVADQLPASPFQNIRLMLLDVDLLDGGSNRTTTVAALVNLIRNLVAAETAGLMLVLWTRHPDWADDVWTRLLEEGGPVPIYIATLSKAEFQDGDGGFDVRRLDAELRNQLSALEPWPRMLEWEEGAREAASNVTSELSRLARLGLDDPTSLAALGPWQDDVRKRFAAILSALAATEMGRENVEDGEDLLRGAYRALSPLLVDQVEHAAMDLAEQAAEAGTAVTELGDGVAMPATLPARLNTRWTISTETKRAWTGNIYRAADDLGKELLRVYPDFRPLLVDHLVGNKRTTEAKDAQRRRDEFESEIIDEILIDIHPVCDHAQRKIASGRLLAGVRLTPERGKKISIASVWKFGPLWDEETEAQYMLAIDLKRPLACSASVLRDATPWRRLRQGVMVELLTSIASHAMRPGTLRFGE